MCYIKDPRFSFPRYSLPICSIPTYPNSNRSYPDNTPLPLTAARMAPISPNLVGTNSKLPLVFTRLRGHLRLPLSSPPNSLNMAAAAASRRQAHWTSIEDDIRTHLVQSLPTTTPPVVAEPMHHMINSTVPKPIAPVLCLAACELVGGRRADAMDAACALHLMDALVRARARLPPFVGPRAEPKSSSPFSEGVLLMTGDGLVPLGFELVARSECGDPSRVLRVIIEIAEAIGGAGTAEGLYMVTDGAAAVEKVCEKTDGRLSACGAACGAILGGAADEAVERLRRFGLYAGTMHGLLCTEGRSEAAEEFRSLARSELEGFDEGKLDDVRELVDWWYENGAVAAIEAGCESDGVGV